MSEARVSDEDLDFLYGLPLDRFTAERDRLSKEAAARGDRDVAGALKSLSKPNIPAWAVNQLARVHPREIEKLLDLREQLAGAGSADDVRRLGEERLRVVAELRAAAEKILISESHGATAATLERVSRTLLAGDDADEKDLLSHGRLVSDLEPSGWASFGPGEATAASEPRTGASDKRSRDKARKLAQDAKEAARVARELSRDAAAAQRAADTARQKADRAQAAADRAREAADAAAQAVKGER